MNPYDELTYRHPRTMGEAFGHRKHEIDTGEHHHGAWFTWSMVILWLSTMVLLGVTR